MNKETKIWLVVAVIVGGLWGYAVAPPQSQVCERIEAYYRHPHHTAGERRVALDACEAALDNR